MSIISAQFTETGMILVNGEMHVPDIETDRDRWGITEWIGQGNTIAPYVAPPKSTIPPQNDMVEALWEKARGDSTKFDSIDSKVGF